MKHPARTVVRDWHDPIEAESHPEPVDSKLAKPLVRDFLKRRKISPTLRLSASYARIVAKLKWLSIYDAVN
jgi:hypothetical protein